MSQPIVSQSDTFADWLEKTNDISRNVGDPDDLTTSVKTNVVAAINSISSDPKDRGGLAKDAEGKLYADVDDNSVNVSENNKLQIKNDGVHKRHINKDVVGDGLRQLQDESLAIAPDQESITTAAGKVAVKDGGVTVRKLALNDPGTIVVWGADRAAVALPPGDAEAVLVSQGAALPPKWSTGGSGTVLGYSGYLTIGRWTSSSSRHTDTIEVTVQCSRQLTNLVNLEPTPGGPKTSGVVTSSDGTDFLNGLTTTPADSDYGFLWSCDQGILTLRMFNYYTAQMSIYHTGDDGYSIHEQVAYGMRVFNVGNDTFISFKLKDVNYRTVRTVSTFFMVAELLAKVTDTTQTYYSNDGTTPIAEWQGGIAYTNGTIVKSSNKLYIMTTQGTQTSSNSAGAPTHTYFGTGITQGTGEKAYGNITWRFLGEI